MRAYVHARLIITPILILIQLGLTTSAATADPVAVSLEARFADLVTHSEADGNDEFGFAVALDGDTAVIGARLDDKPPWLNQGAAYVYVRDGTTWTQQAVLVPDDGDQGDNFGFALGIDGDTIVVGSRSDDGPAGMIQGSAYVFTRDGTSWTLQAHLFADDPSSVDAFGFSVAIDGDTIAIGAHSDDGLAGPDQGSAYVFVRDGSNWSQEAQLLASDAQPEAQFGISISLQDDTLVVGARRQDVIGEEDAGAVYVFERTGTVWAEQSILHEIVPTEFNLFGHAVAMSGNTLAVAVPYDTVGSVYVYVRIASTWFLQAHLVGNLVPGAEFGHCITLEADKLAVTAPYTSPNGTTTHIYKRQEGIWMAQPTLLAGEELSAVETFKGTLVSLNSGTLLIGAPRDDGLAGVDEGTAYVYVDDGGAWTQQARIARANDGDLSGNDQFGSSVAIAQDLAVVGVPYDNAAVGPDRGTAITFNRTDEAGWARQSRLKADDAAPYDWFGASVAATANTIAVGAPRVDAGGFNDQGAVYVFVPDGLNWGQQAKLTANLAVSSGDELGFSVAIDGNTVVAGAPYDDTPPGSGSDRGGAYVFVRNGSTWTQQAKLSASDGGTGDHFGWSVAISGNTIIVGSPDDNENPAADRGAAYVFVRSGSIWTQQVKLTANDPASFDRFGVAVSIDGDRVAVGAPDVDDVAGDDQGAVYLYVRAGTSWSFQTRLAAADAAEGDRFGYSLSLDDPILFVGAPLDATAIGPERGSLYAFRRNGSAWTQQAKVGPDPAYSYLHYGYSVAQGAGRMISGAPWVSTPEAFLEGGAYIYSVALCGASADGDLNGDGFVDGEDVSEFVRAAVELSTAAMDVCAADFNRNGRVDTGDVPAFLNLVLNP